MAGRSPLDLPPCSQGRVPVGLSGSPWGCQGPRGAVRVPLAPQAAGTQLSPGCLNGNSLPWKFEKLTLHFSLFYLEFLCFKIQSLAKKVKNLTTIFLKSAPKQKKKKSQCSNLTSNLYYLNEFFSSLCCTDEKPVVGVSSALSGVI